MKSAVILSALFAAGALATPIEKRDVVTAVKWDVVVQTVWTTVNGPSPTPVPNVVPEAAHNTPPQGQTQGQSQGQSQSQGQPQGQPQGGSSIQSPGAKASYQQKVLYSHNVHRANHSAPALTWSDEMASIAQAEAELCIFAHNRAIGNVGYGQNIAAGSNVQQIEAVITNEFYNGEVNNFLQSYYGMANPPMNNFEHWGHFSQVVWKGTQSVGCATVDCSGHKGQLKDVGGDVPPYFTVCNYSPAGNMGGEYGDNVGQPLYEAPVYA